MQREKLRAIIDTAAVGAGCSETEIARLTAAADGINRVAIGTFAIDRPGFECGCPATVAGYYDAKVSEWNADASEAVQGFPTQFDGRISADLTLRVDGSFGSEYLPVED